MGQRQWTQTGAEEVPYEGDKKILCFEDESALAQAAQRGCVFSFSRHIQMLPGCFPVQATGRNKESALGGSWTR